MRSLAKEELEVLAADSQGHLSDSPTFRIEQSAYA